MDDDVLYSEAHEMIRLANAKRWLARTLPAAIGMVLLCRAFEADATGWKPNVREGADIVMKDHRWPFWDAGTYYCLWYMSFVPSHPRLGYSCLLYTSPSPRDLSTSRMPSSA